MRKKITKLQAMAESRGCTKAEADVAARKLTEAENSVAHAVEILVGLNWGDVQARGIISELDRLPPWRDRTDWRWSLLYDWCSANQHIDPMVLKNQLRFLSEDLRNSLQAIGIKVNEAKTETDAAKAFEPYANKLGEKAND
jgi:Protein of unknown function (DUF2786)